MFFNYLTNRVSYSRHSFKMERTMTLKIVVPKGKQAAANAALQEVDFASYEEWATGVEGLLMERKAYVKEVRTRYKEYNIKNGAYIFVMEFVGTYGQLVNIFYTDGLTEALELLNPYMVATSVWRWNGTYYSMKYVGNNPLDIKCPPLADATPRPAPPTPAAPARPELVKEERPPFMEPFHRMRLISLEELDVAQEATEVKPVSILERFKNFF